jgi:hypothetical protein
MQTSLIPLAMPEDVAAVIVEAYINESIEIRSILTQMSVDVPHYQDLQWRLDIVVGFQLNNYP